jgi:hypothetical protein
MDMGLVKEETDDAVSFSIRQEGRNKYKNTFPIRTNEHKAQDDSIEPPVGS